MICAMQPSLNQASSNLIHQLLSPSEHDQLEQNLYPVLQNLLRQDIPPDLIQGVAALFNQWHEQCYGRALPTTYQDIERLELTAHLAPIENHTKLLQELIAKAIGQPHYHLEFLELLYTCGKLGLKLPTLGKQDDQNQILSQLYYLIRANKPLKEHLQPPQAVLPSIHTHANSSAFFMPLAVLCTGFGLMQLGLMLWTYVLTLV